MKKIRIIMPAALLAFVGACESVLQTEPTTSLSATQQIVDSTTAQASVVGAMSALQSGSYYGLDLLMLGDLPADNTVWSGTFQFLGEIGTNDIRSDNAEITGMWSQIYTQIDRDNVILARVPALTDLSEAGRNNILGQAYLMRALSYHNLVKFWGDVPMPLVPATSPTDAQSYTRTPQAQVYAQILSDLDKAQTGITHTNTRFPTALAARALRARVLLYRAGLAGNANAAADYQAALDAAQLVLTGRDTLTEAYANLFTATGSNTAEDLFRIAYAGAETNSYGNYYLQVGRAEVAPSPNIDAAYPAGDLRKAWSVGPSGNTNRPLNGNKYRARPGTEHVHVIRLAELVLIKAEVLARQNNLTAAVAQYNKVRVRAGLARHTLGVEVTTQQQVLDAIDRERRLELAFEGDRWPDLVRTGRAVSVRNLAAKAGQALFPIPLRDIRTSPGLVQNPGY